MYKNNIEMRILVNGRQVREYQKDGITFIESRHGSNYTIQIKNDSNDRIMTVVSVDGLDVITGKSAEKSNTGYIINALSTTKIKGYRLSDNDSAAFVFVSKDKSYVTQTTGDARNSGVIGVRVFAEKPAPITKKIIEEHHHHHYPSYPHVPWVYPKIDPWNPWSQPTIWFSTTSISYNADMGDLKARSLGSSETSGQSVSMYNCSLNPSSAPTSPSPTKGIESVSNFSAPFQQDSFDTGTGWGEKQTDVVRTEKFRVGKLISELVLYYASEESLKGMGIDLSDTPIIADPSKQNLPKPFGDSKYCQPPIGWNG